MEKLLDSVNITCNKNTIPNDPKSPFVTSGVRLGTPAVTSRGLNTGDMDQIAEAIAMMIKEGEPAADRARAIVAELTAKYPLNKIFPKVCRQGFRVYCECSICGGFCVIGNFVPITQKHSVLGRSTKIIKHLLF